MRDKTTVPACLIFLLFCLCFAGSIATTEENPKPIKGYSLQASEMQRRLENKFHAIPHPEEARRWHRYFTAVPHPAGSERTKEIARYIEQNWKEQGLDDVTIHRYDVLSSDPIDVRVEMVAPEHYVPTLREDVYEVDPDTAHPDVSSAWTSFSASGEVTAPVVYANSGNPADYDLLRENGIDPRGKIVIVRYSNPYSYRGFKALTAEREGAAAMIVYSDPAEDGYAQGEVFPEGPWGPESHIQRGGIAYDFIVPGDPLTPGWASTPGAHQIPIEEAVSIPKVIAVPMSHRDMQPILEKMGGPMAPEAWQGALPIEYRLGGEDVRLHLDVEMDTHIQSYYVVEGRIRGDTLPDEWVVMGNHHDAWVFGGRDPSSGTATMMEMTRALGQLKTEGWRPKRTLVFCAWDGEEVTLTGSTEWGEHFAEELKRKAVAYLNVDSAASGSRLNLDAVGSLAPMIIELSKELQDPSVTTLYESWRRPAEGAPGPKDGAVLDEALVETRIGSGTDHTVFLNYLGRPVVNMSFVGPYGVYHSVYDDHYWINQFGDPGFRYHILMAQLWGTMALRLANAEILPLDFDTYAASIREFIGELGTIEGVEGKIDIQDLVFRTQSMRREARRFNHRAERALARGALEPETAAAVNDKLMQVELNWLNPAGIPGRPWFKHTLYAPRYTYAAMVFPGITEAAEQGDWMRAREQAEIVAAKISQNTELIAAAAHDLAAFAPSSDSLEGKLRGIRGDFDGRMGIYVENVVTGETIAIDADSLYETFSVIKVPIMAEVMRQVGEGKLSLSKRIKLEAKDRRIPSGVLYALDPGLEPTLRDLVTLMIIISDNEATDVVAELVGADNVTSFMGSLGLHRTKIRFSDLDWDRLWLGDLDPAYSNASGDQTVAFPFQKYSGEEVGDAFRHVIEETGLYFGRSTVREMGQVFAKMARGELVSKEASDFMISILEKQQVDHRFPRYLGGDVRIAHKTGDGQPWVGNDAGILWIKDQPVVLVVFTGHHRGGSRELNDAVARVAAAVADHYGGSVDPAGLK
jgi:N-acetylated-alpha-linked acidic dipeptidase